MPQIETSTRKITARLEREGWVNAGGAKHDRFTHPVHSGFVIVPRHREQSPGVAKSIAKGAGWI